MASEDEILRTAMFYSVPNASDCVNVFYHRVIGTPDDSDCLDALEDWTLNEWGPDWQDFASEDCSILSIAVDVINTDGTVDRNIGSKIINLAGTTVNEAEPSVLAGWLGAGTNQPKVRGSKYIPGIPQDSIDDGILDVEVLADLALLALDYVLDISIVGGGTLVAGVLSRTLLSFVRFNDSVSFTDVPAVQRRRKPNVGS